MSYCLCCGSVSTLFGQMQFFLLFIQPSIDGGFSHFNAQGPQDAPEEHQVVGTNNDDKVPKDIPRDPQASDGLEPEALTSGGDRLGESY